MFQTEERCLASFVSARQKSDQKAPNNHLFHLSAYLNRGEESPFISDLYLGGGLQELTLLIRFLSLRGHQLEERWHGLTAPFMKKAKQPVPLPDVPRPEPEGLRAEALGEPGTLEAKESFWEDDRCF
eukprot:g19000.t1